MYRLTNLDVEEAADNQSAQQILFKHVINLNESRSLIDSVKLIFNDPERPTIVNRERDMSITSYSMAFGEASQVFTPRDMCLPECDPMDSFNASLDIRGGFNVFSLGYKFDEMDYVLQT